MSTDVKSDYKRDYKDYLIVGSHGWLEEKLGEIPKPGLQNAAPLYKPSRGTFSNANINIKPCHAKPKFCKVNIRPGPPGADPRFQLAPVWISPHLDECGNTCRANPRTKIQKQKLLRKLREKSKKERKEKKTEKTKRFSSFVFYDAEDPSSNTSDGMTGNDGDCKQVYECLKIHHPFNNI